ncbi:MAG: hypothetical protein M1827_004112 [Pycnora praestabilis]|nr:MAG: hypothetical protein M1827_004112 [Pycnora praestabilis]
MAQVRMPHPLPMSFQQIYEDSPGSELYPSKLSEERTSPEPNPPFVFPARRSAPTTPSIPSSSSRRRPLSSHDTSGESGFTIANSPKRQSVSTLPSFDFHPSSTQDSVNGMSSPPPSPTKSLAVPIRPHGHRRGGSEFIGGDGKAGGLGLMSTSPTKGDDVLPPPASSTKFGPPAGRRGHAHRRSGAISCHDFSMVLKPTDPNTITRGGSAPTTPSDTDAKISFLPTDEAVPAHGATDKSSSSGSLSTDLGRARGMRRDSDQPRTRVGFSDTLEFIPRPLSTISSETSSSITTVLGGHSVSGSISSIVSASNASPPSTKSRRSSLNTMFEDDMVQPRPRTAGAVMASSENELRSIFGHDVGTMKRPISAPGSPSRSISKTCSTPPPFQSQMKHLLVQERRLSDEVSPKTTPAAEQIEHLHLTSPPITPSRDSLMGSWSVSEESRKSPDRKVIKKQKKVRTWAGSILSRKTRQRVQKPLTVNKRSQTPPLRSHTTSSISTLASFRNDHDMSCAYRPPSERPTLNNNTPTDIAAWKPRESSPKSDLELMSPIIDLDAALGPFNTPTHGSVSENASGGGFSVAKRRMHSSGNTGGFTGPGMHYHRRAESAPEMVAFDFGHFGISRLGSSSTMADVFEEDEEEDGDENGILSTRCDHRGVEEHDNEEGLGIGIQVVDADDLYDGAGMDWTCDNEHRLRRLVKHTDCDFIESKPQQFEVAKEEQHALQHEPIEEEQDSDVSAGDEEVPRASSITKSSDSTVTPKMLPQLPNHKSAPASLELGHPVLNPPHLTPDTSSSFMSSPVPSPSFHQNSFDFPRIANSASSMTDSHTLNSLLLGEPGPEVRMSVDDVPSLTSSNSTITSGVNSAGHSLSGAAYPPGKRSGSISSATGGASRPRITSKRASLVSLSRLVGGSHGERSKLNIEDKPRPDSPEKSKEKKGKRLSRMMSFWKFNKDTHKS